MTTHLQKRLMLALTALLCMSPQGHAQPREWAQISSLGRQVWKADHVVTMQDNRAYGILLTAQDHPGYIVASTDERLPAVLAYSDSDLFRTDSLPPHIQSWMDGYAAMQAACEYAPATVASWLQASTTDTTQDVSPLLGNTLWGQDNPYNIYCPKYNGLQCPTGCVATALAQIMRYHQWPRTGTGTIAYRTDTHKLSISYDFSTAFFDWSQINDAYSPVEYAQDATDYTASSPGGHFIMKSIDVDDDYSLVQCNVRISSLTVTGASGFVGSTAILLTNEQGRCLMRVSDKKEINSPNSGRILSTGRFPIAIPSSLPDGSYRLYNAVRGWNAQGWTITNMQNIIPAAQHNYLELTKQGQRFLVAGQSFPCSLSEEQSAPVATLLQAVGAAVKMDYAPGGSGSNDTNTLKGTKTYLGYDADMYFADPDNYSDEQWHRLLRSELNEGRPVYYTGLDKEVGHAFVIDGYRVDEKTRLVYYHVNWGWNGLCNGYYLLNMLRPAMVGTGGSAGSNYSNNTSMLIGMKPDDGIPQTSMVCRSLDLRTTEAFAGQPLSVCLSRLAVNGSVDFEGNIRLELQSEEQPAQAPVTIYSEAHRTISQSRGLVSHYMPCHLPQDIAPGSYRLTLICTDTNGIEVPIEVSQWPLLTVLPNSEWVGGPLTQTRQELAITGIHSYYGEAAQGRMTLLIDTLRNTSADAIQGTLALLLCDEQGSMLQPIASTLKELTVGGYSILRGIQTDALFSRHIPDGRYLLCIGFLPANESLWSYCYQMDYEGDVWWSGYKPLFLKAFASSGDLYIEDQRVQGADIPWTDGIASPTTPTGSHTIYDLSGRRGRTGTSIHDRIIIVSDGTVPRKIVTTRKQ